MGVLLMVMTLGRNDRLIVKTTHTDQWSNGLLVLPSDSFRRVPRYRGITKVLYLFLAEPIGF